MNKVEFHLSMNGSLSISTSNDDAVNEIGKYELVKHIESYDMNKVAFYLWSKDIKALSMNEVQLHLALKDSRTITTSIDSDVNELENYDHFMISHP